MPIPMMTKRDQKLREIVKGTMKKLNPSKKVKVLVPIGCRSDAGLSAPIIKRLIKHPKFDCIPYNLIASNFMESYKETEKRFKFLGQPDIILCVGDRIEMTAAACAAFHNGVKIAHVYSGVVNNPIATLDDINRHCISLWADICFCESERAVDIIADLWSSIGKKVEYFYTNDYDFEKDNIYNVGITHLDDFEVDDSLVPDWSYELIIYNQERNESVNEAYSKIIEKTTNNLIYIDSNPDNIKFKEGLRKKFEEIDFIVAHKKCHTNLPRAQFFGLLQKCERFITNSSAAYYEAPHFLKPEQIILVGERNRNRSTPKRLETGASDKIVKILEEYFKNNKKG